LDCKLGRTTEWSAVALETTDAIQDCDATQQAGKDASLPERCDLREDNLDDNKDKYRTIVDFSAMQHCCRKAS
jgi:hypothetical protein